MPQDYIEHTPVRGPESLDRVIKIRHSPVLRRLLEEEWSTKLPGLPAAREHRDRRLADKSVG